LAKYCKIIAKIRNTEKQLKEIRNNGLQNRAIQQEKNRENYK
jgi:hypothetical protein